MNILKIAAMLLPILFSTGLAVAGPGEAGHSHAGFSAGQPGDPKKPFRVVEVTMHEGDGKMGYTPESLTVKRGEQIKFVITNGG